jgi:diaminopimelate epimerase
MNIPFHKAHGAKNDFLLTWAADVASAGSAQLSAIAIAICDRNSGVGADGWEIVGRPEGGRPATLRLFNPDGGEVEISGNGTRCAAALLVSEGHADSEVVIDTGAGRKQLWLKSRNGHRFEFEMDMGEVRIEDAAAEMAGYPATILNAGNPQCALICDEIPGNWKQIGAELERHPRFPHRSNISFVRAIDRHTIEARFFERGAGATMSSGTGSTGAAVAAITRGLAASPVTILTEAGPLRLRWEDSIYLTGPAELVARGEFYVSQ